MRENVSEALRLFEPWGVDVVSGVESRAGKKDEARLREFVAAVRGTQNLGEVKGVMEETSSNTRKLHERRAACRGGQTSAFAPCPGALARTAAATFPRR